jgi:polysaccharide biosynthesis protein PslG
MPVGRKRPIGLVRGWIAALALAISTLGGFASVAQAVPANFWGVDPQVPPSSEQFQRLKAGGVDSVRIPIIWGTVQTVEGGPFDWTTVDAVVANATRAGIEVLPFLYGAPAWAVPPVVVPGSHGGYKAPKTLPVKTAAARAGWIAFAQQAAARYGPGGTFWAEHPQLPPRPIGTWQIWNEENFKYFVVRPNPAEYGKLVNISFTALRSVDPAARLVLGGLFAEPKEANWKVRPPQAYFATDFLTRMYRATPGIKSKFSGIALHPYTSRYQHLTVEIEAVRAVLRQNRDSAKGLWITEIGWSSQPPDPLRNAFAKGPQGQVKQLRGAFSLFVRMAAKWRLKQVFWYAIEDAQGVCNFCGGSGLFASGFVAKRSWQAYVRFAGGTP